MFFNSATHVTEKAAVVKGGGANGGVKGRRDEQPTAAKGEGEQKRRGRQK